MSLIGVIASAARRRAGFLPTDISGCAVWLDFSDSATLFDATSGGSTPAADGNIRRIEDKSGNSRHFAESASDAAPIRKLAQINGLDAAYFTSDEMRRAESLSTSGGGALFMVVQRTADGAGAIHGIRGNSATNAHPRLGVYFESFGNATRREWSQAYRTDVHVYSVTSDGAGTWLVRINGTTVRSLTGQTGANTQNPILIGAGAPATRLGDGYYCELAVYTSAVSTGDRDALESALMDKWGI